MVLLGGWPVGVGLKRADWRFCFAGRLVGCDWTDFSLGWMSVNPDGDRRGVGAAGLDHEAPDDGTLPFAFAFALPCFVPCAAAAAVIMETITKVKTQLINRRIDAK